MALFPTAESVPGVAAGGTYTLVLALDEPAAPEVGALGTCQFPAGGYAYTGSARASGGFARVDRHRRVAAGEHDARHWHVDFLTGHPATDLVDVARAAGIDAECRIARRLGDGPVPGFGASDCDCASHLSRRETVAEMARAVAAVYDDTSG